jgi:glutathione S-transferase
MRALYHFTHSPFSRRARLALAHKGLDCELREARENPAWRDQAGSLVALKTVPVLVDDGAALGDSTAITRWLDARYANAPRIWPEGDDALRAVEVAALVDAALGAIADVGTRYYALRDSPSWPGVKGEMLGRAQRALDALGTIAKNQVGSTLCESWSAADMWLYSAAAWLGGLPGRVSSSANAAQIVAVGGWTLPESVRAWAQSHDDRADVRAIYGS